MKQEQTVLISELFNVLHSMLQVQQLIQSLQALQNQTDATIALTELPHVWSTALQNVWQQATKTGISFSDFLITLRKELQNVTPTQVTLAYEPNTQQVNELVSTLRKRFDDPKMVVEFHYEPQIIAGCIIEHAGKRYDCSLRQKLAQHA